MKSPVRYSTIWHHRFFYPMTEEDEVVSVVAHSLRSSQRLHGWTAADVDRALQPIRSAVEAEADDIVATRDALFNDGPGFGPGFGNTERRNRYRQKMLIMGRIRSDARDDECGMLG